MRMQMLLIMKDSRIEIIKIYMWIGICRKIF